MILSARLLYGVFKLPEKILKTISILMYTLIKFGIKSYRCYIEIMIL